MTHLWMKVDDIKHVMIALQEHFSINLHVHCTWNIKAANTYQTHPAVPAGGNMTDPSSFWFSILKTNKNIVEQTNALPIWNTAELY